MIRIEERVDSTIVNDSFYNVIMFNDEETPFNYVIAVLNQLFDYSIADSKKLAMHIHMNGTGIVATLPMAEAYEKVAEVDAMNNMFGFLLQTDVKKA